MAVILAGALMFGVSLASEGELVDLAVLAGIESPELLREASLATGLAPRDYLLMTGELQQPAPPSPPANAAVNAAVEARLDCISWYESRHTPSARNPRSGAAGQYQYLWSTWMTTPQGKAGYSPYDPVASREASRWMIAQGRVREWDVVRLGLC